MSLPKIDMDALTAAERLALLEQIWESLARTPDAVPLTTAQRRELDRRLDDLEREENGTRGIPWDEVLRRIRSR
ncbi:MAG: addiction module protein [Chloroflexi bacterium]|nr:addiction module protein [Chloroflexota bacterium]